jgi:hypothetical protein
MYPDFKELLSALNAHGANYVIVRATKDIDLLIRPHAQNAKSLYQALAQFGASLEGLTHEDFAKPGFVFGMDR